MQIERHEQWVEREYFAFGNYMNPFKTHEDRARHERRMTMITGYN